MASRRGTRLVTLTGPGGTGKTRVALATAERVADLFGDGVWLVDLTSLREPDLVLPAIARSLGFTDQVGQALERQLASYLADAKLLLVLDNFEQVLPAGTILSRLLARAPGLKVLVTSREPLQVSWEREFPIPPLPVPDLSRPVPPEVLGAVPSVALFVQRTQAVVPEFRLTEHNAGTVAQLCARLDGLPLATELAAARSRVLPVDEILRRLSNRLVFLTGGARDQPARHRTLRAAIEWSYDLLTPAERALFRQLGLLVGTWSLAVAQAVVDPLGASAEGGDPAQALLDGVGSLVDKNLVRTDAHVAGEVRFGMLETIREYAVDRLVAERRAAPPRTPACRVPGCAERGRRGPRLWPPPASLARSPRARDGQYPGGALLEFVRARWRGARATSARIFVGFLVPSWASDRRP